MASDSSRPDPAALAFSAAADYARLGWAPIPLRGKRPLAAGWPSTTADNWEARWVHGAENVGLCTGPASGFVALDVDLQDGGLDRWEELTSVHGAPAAPTVRSGSGGLHLYFALDERTARLTKGIKRISHESGEPAGIDIIAAGGQVVAPPSFHPNGVQYRWLVPFDPSQPLPAMPDWLYDLLARSESASRAFQRRLRS